MQFYKIGFLSYTKVSRIIIKLKLRLASVWNEENQRTETKTEKER